MKVKDCMCEDVCCVKPETKITEVAKLMSENHIGCIPVCDNNNCICGILTDRDILEQLHVTKSVHKQQQVI